MCIRFHLSLSLLFLVTAVLARPTASMAQIKVITSGGFATPLQAVLPEFEKATGIQVSVTRGASQGDGPNTIGAQLRRGEPADVVIMSREGLDELIEAGRIVKGTDIDVAQTPLGMSVRAGAPKPDIGTVEAFKQTLLHAKSITIPPSTTGIYMTTKLFPQLGIAAALSGKITNAGLSDLAIRPVSELLGAPDMDFVGTVPSEIQFISVFSTAVVAGSKEADASKRLMAFLASEKALAALKKSGMERPKSH